jgi:sugar phosphate isomerase/epimerase
MRRRDFLVGGIAAGMTMKLLGEARPNQAKLDRLSVMTLCFNRILKDPDHPDDPQRTLEILDVPQMIADRFGIHYVEFQHTHFTSTELPYLREVRDRVKQAKSRMNQINLEFDPFDISSPQQEVRLETIDLTKQWIDHAVVLNCPRVMINQGTLAPEVLETAKATLKTIVEYGKTRKVFVTAENRGGGHRPPPPPGTPPRPATAGWEVLVEVLKATGAYANPDIGNFPDEASRAAGLRVLYPLSSGSSHVHYAPERYNAAAAIQISKDVGYKGLYSVEASRNNGPDPYAAVQMIVEELIKDI